MNPLEFLICLNADQSPADLEKIIAPFNARLGFKEHVNVHSIPWEDYRTELTSVAIHNRGPDMSQVGAPLVSDLVAMNALRQFTAAEIAALGGASAFVPVAWHSSMSVDKNQVWAIPWLADPRAIYYWRDMLEKASLDESTAFQTFDHMQETFQRLQASGVSSPWVIPTDYKLSILQTAVSWIWGAGGEIIDEVQKTPLFHQPPALAGLHAYYGLYRYMPKENQPLGFSQAFGLFANRQAAVTMGNLVPLLAFLKNASPDQRARLGVAFPPGPSYVGGSSLVIWRHSIHDHTAVNLVNFLLSKDAQRDYCQVIGYIPVRADVLEEPPYSVDPILKGFVQSLHRGRIFPQVKMGGLIEERLSTALYMIWRAVISNPQVDLEAAIQGQFEPIIRRIESWIV